MSGLTSRSDFHSAYSCGCFENMFTNRTCEKHKKSWDAYMRTQKGSQESNVWQYYQNIANQTNEDSERQQTSH